MKSGCFKMLAMLVLGIAVVLGLSSCESSTPASRAAKSPAVMGQLSQRDRDAVMSGTIAEGMSKDAVFIAWGRPDSITHGSVDGKRVETWTYTSLRSVYRPYGMGFGVGYYGRYHRHVYPSAAIAMGPDYVPVTSQVVRFRNDKVVAWETADVR